MKHTQKGGNEMKKHIFILPVFLVAVVALILGATAPQAWATGGLFEEFEDAECGFEVNLTDVDTGFTASVDAVKWKSLQIYRMDDDHSDKQLLFWTGAFNSLRRLGLTELRFESDEPEGQFQTVLDKFPEGICKFFGKKAGYGYLLSFFDLSHDFACAPTEFDFGGEAITLKSDMGDICVEAGQDLEISWTAVGKFLNKVKGENDFTCNGSLDLGEISYEVFVETGEDELGEDFEPSQTLHYDPFAGPEDDEDPPPTGVVIPGDFLKANTPYKFELLVHLEGNASIVEIEFEAASDCDAE